MALDAFVNEDGTNEIHNKGNKRKSALVSWVIDQVDPWIEHRDRNYRQKWEEFYRLWRGIWSEEDKTRKSERSKLISPALQQAIESTVAEIEEATFGRGKYWFDVEDDVVDQDQREAFLTIRDRLLEDMESAGIPTELGKIFLYGAIFGTGLGKVLVEKTIEVKPIPKQISGVLGSRSVLGTQTRDIIIMKLEAIHPLNFAIDPAARSIDESIGCAHVVIKPTHTIKQKQRDGIYESGDLGSYEGDMKVLLNEEENNTYENYTKIVEYHGLVPSDLLYDEDEFEDILAVPKATDSEDDGFEFDDENMVEAIVTIANDSVLLRADENPLIMKDRGFIAYQHDLVPNSFWGRGVAEKGYNSQKALDAELRARMDSLALITHPMMAIDATKLPRGQKLNVAPGKMFLTNGNPAEVFMPFKFGTLEPASFAQTGDLERQVTMATGAMDTAAPTSVNARNATASGMSMMTASMLKRHKKSKANIDRMFLKPMIEKILWRYMQFRPERYPAADYKFKTVTSMGLMAREYEQTQMTQLLSVTPAESPMFGVILKGIIDNSSVENKKELIEGLQQWLTPDPQEQQMNMMLKQLEIEKLQLENEKLKSEVVENYSQAETRQIKSGTDNFNAITNRITAMTNATKEKSNGTKPNY